MDVVPDVTLYAALYGELEPHPWRSAAASHDAYSLFVARSSAMGWLAPAVEGAAGGVWGMNDAASRPPGSPGPGPVARFQVGLTRPAAQKAPAPLQAFLTCAGDVVARLGVLRLAAAEVLLPVPGGGRRPAPTALIRDAGWFTGLDPRARTRVRLTLDGGQDPAVGPAGPGILGWLRGLPQDVFRCEEAVPADGPDGGVPLLGGVTDALWHGPSAGHRTTFHGSLAEWSPAALGWLSALLAEAAARHAVPGPLMLTAAVA